MLTSILPGQLVATQIHPDVVDWVRRVVRNGGAIPSQKTVSSLSNFYVGVVRNNLTSKMKAVNCFVPDNLIASITPLIKVAGNDPWTNNGPFTAGDLTVSGLTGNGSTKYLDTGIPTNTFTYTDMAATTYTVDVSANNVSTLFGSTSVPGAKELFQFLPRASGTLYCDFPIEVAVAARITGPNSTGGYFCVSRTASNRVDLYKANSSIGHTTFGFDTSAVGNYVSVYNWFVQAVNITGSASQHSSYPISFVAFHTSVSSAESSILYNLVQTMRQQLGGGYV